MRSVKTENRRKKLIQLIHIGKGKLALSEDSYRALLTGVCGKDSCKKMTIKELENTLKAIKSAGFSVQKRMPLRPQEIGLATPEQLSYIKGLWELAARVKTDKALAAFIRRIAKVDDIRFLNIKSAQKVILAVRDIAVKAGYDPDCVPNGSVTV